MNLNISDTYHDMMYKLGGKRVKLDNLWKIKIPKLCWLTTPPPPIPTPRGTATAAIFLVDMEMSKNGVLSSEKVISLKNIQLINLDNYKF